MEDSCVEGEFHWVVVMLLKHSFKAFGIMLRIRLKETVWTPIDWFQIAMIVLC